MTDPTFLLLFMTATVALNLAPGPDMLVIIAVACLAASAGRWLSARSRVEGLFRRLTASAFVGLGLRLALAGELQGVKD